MERFAGHKTNHTCGLTFADLLLFDSFKKGSILLGRCFAKLDKLSSLVGLSLTDLLAD